MNRTFCRNSELVAGLFLGLLSAHCSATNDTPLGNTGGVVGTGGAKTTGGAPSSGGSATGGVVAAGGLSGGSGGSTPGSGGTTGGSMSGGASTGGAAGASGAGGRNEGSGGLGGASTGGAKATGGASGSGAGGSGPGGTGGGGGASATGGNGGSVGKFSFFLTSLVAIRRLSGSPDGFGGDLRYGEATGLAGADKICTEIAETSMPGAGTKTWRAFLSVAGPPVVDAIDRVGEGPWYDRKGRLLAMTKAALAMQRPQGGDSVIVNDFPNEDGVPNHNPDGTGNVDNHDTLTGSTTAGKLDSGKGATCSDWTSSMGVSGMRPRVGHSWPAGSGMNWMSALYEGGCAPGINLVETGGPKSGVYTVGTGGGYGGFYCFALTP